MKTTMKRKYRKKKKDQDKPGINELLVRLGFQANGLPPAVLKRLRNLVDAEVADADKDRANQISRLRQESKERLRQKLESIITYKVVSEAIAALIPQAGETPTSTEAEAGASNGGGATFNPNPTATT